MESKLKKEKLNKIITVILIGLLLLIVVVPMGEEKGGVITDESTGEESSSYYDSYADYYEKKLKVILEKSYGQGTMEVMVHMKESDSSGYMYNEQRKMEVDGVLIVADVRDVSVMGDISFAVCALFDLPAHKVAVIIK